MSQLGTYLQQWGHFVSMLALWVFVVVGVFDAVRKLAVFGYSKRPAILASGLLVVSGLVGGFYFWAHQKEVGLIAGLQHRHTPLPEDWAKDQSAKARHEGSKAYATVAFRGEGLLLKHLDANGRWVEFHPTAEDIGHRDFAVAVTTRLAEQSQMFWRLALEWWLGCLIAAVGGFIAARSDRKPAANSAAQPDARDRAARAAGRER
jgi:hypothetical protein